VMMRPAHAYVPGRNARHPETAFDAVKSSVVPGMSVARIAGSEAWQTGLDLYRTGYFWECHEVLEAVWMALPDGPDRSAVQAVIQLANAALKERMGKPRAVLRLCDMAQGLAEAGAASELRPDWLVPEIANLRAKNAL